MSVEVKISHLKKSILQLEKFKLKIMVMDKVFEMDGFKIKNLIKYIYRI